MSGEELLMTISGIKEDLIEESEAAFNCKKSKNSWTKWIAVAVCICIAFGGYFLIGRSTSGVKDGSNNITKDNNINEQENTEVNNSVKNTGITTADMVPVTSIEELLKQTELVVKGRVKNKTEIGDMISYDIEVEECLYGEKTDDVITLKVWNNKDGRFEDVWLYDYDIDSSYVFFLNYYESADNYAISCQSAGYIKVKKDKVEVKEYDKIFGECKSYSDVKKIIK